MYLKEIEISGFKSFADKITLNLDNNITCIVGPNGSGKSNIVDAIRFVLGEQSVKSLRGDNLMSDVIFGGSKNRNPMHVASVTLTFNNTDHYLNIPYELVSVKRRLYKTGDNEYFLNGEKCRLKDIVDLFLDSNIGRDSFNIIGQGEIAKILSNSALDRRIVIEEAAGILKYKKRREEAFRKLDKTNLNLERINDIILEVESRVEPLRIQSEKAKKYIDVKDKLEHIEVALLASEITSVNLKYQNIKSNISEKEQTLIHLNNLLNDPEIDNYKLKELELSKIIQEKNNQLINLTKEKEEYNSRRLISKERMKYNANDIKVYENIEYLKERNLKLDNDLKILTKEEERNLIKKEELETSLNELISNINDIRKKKDGIINKYNIENKEILEINNKIEILKSNLSSNVYLNSNVRKILDNPKLTGIINALMNIVKTSNIYQKCLDVVSLSNKNFLIARDEYSIKEAINYLKNNNLGRATFLPINIIKPKYVDKETLLKINEEKSYLGLLSDFLEYDEMFKNIILNQYGNILVVNDLENGNRISKLIDNKYRIVTLDGEVIHVGGSVTGGSVADIKSSSGLENSLKELENILNIKYDNIKRLNINIETIDSEINDIDRNIYNKRSDLIKVIEEKNNYLNKHQELEKEIEKNKGELKSLQGDEKLEELDTAYYNKSLECDLLEKEIHNLSEEKNKLQAIILEREGLNKENRLNYSNLDKEVNNLKIELSKLDNKLDQNLNILNTDYNLTYEKAKTDYILELDFDLARDKVKEYKQELKNIGMVNLDSIKEFESVNERYTYLSSERDDLYHAKEMLYSIIEDMDEVMQKDFIDTFKELEVEFKKVFREMFKGGDASLSLTNPSNILETGVDIIACPPGKKLKTVTLLSGGEKTLTAISLLFAILNIRKVPFCVFDEVEAALDEANVDNFGTYLEHYKTKTQFLLITHKKRTMEYAKTLYGITMQESGVSKLVSVKLEDNK